MKLIPIILFIMTSLTGFGQNNQSATNSKDSLIGKTYRAEISYGCGKMIGGGFNQWTFCHLCFERDSVKVMYDKLREASYTDDSSEEEIIEHNRTTKAKFHKWKMQNDKIIIENLNDYGELIFKDNQIIGKNSHGGELIFHMTKYPPLLL